MINFAGIQINNYDADGVPIRDMNLERAGSLIKKNKGLELYVLPELSSTGYADRVFDNLDILAEELHGASFQYFSSISRMCNCFICYGFPRITSRGYTICQAVVNPSGELVTAYDKIHIAHFGDSREKNYFVRGSSITTFQIGECKIGISICYDFRFPEFIRMMALNEGIDLLLHPVAFSKDNSYPSWHHFVVTRSLENQVYTLSINRAGKSFGGSVLCPPWIDYDIKPSIIDSQEQLLIGKVDLDLIRYIRNQYSLREDRWKYC